MIYPIYIAWYISTYTGVITLLWGPPQAIHGGFGNRPRHSAAGRRSLVYGFPTGRDNSVEVSMFVLFLLDPRNLEIRESWLNTGNLSPSCSGEGAGGVFSWFNLECLSFRFQPPMASSQTAKLAQTSSYFHQAMKARYDWCTAGSESFLGLLPCHPWDKDCAARDGWHQSINCKDMEASLTWLPKFIKKYEWIVDGRFFSQINLNNDSRLPL